jgi:serine/threonine-protein kinase
MESFGTFRKLKPVVTWFTVLVRKRWFPASLLTAAALLLFVTESGPFLWLEHALYDELSTRRKPPVSGEVVLVGIDDYALSRLGPAPRMAVSRAIRKLSAMGATTVAVDLSFHHEEANPALEELRLIANSIGEDKALMKDRKVKGIRKELKRAAGRSDADAALVKALKVRARLVMSMHMVTGEEEGLSAPTFIQRHSVGVEPPGELGERIIKDISGLKNPMHALRSPSVRASGIETPFTALASKARALGHNNVTPDPDGIVRRHMLLIEEGGRFYPSLTLQAALRHKGLKVSGYKGVFRERGLEGLDFGDLRVPADSDFSMLLSSASLPPAYTILQVLDDTVPEDIFKGKAVVLGNLSREAVRYRTQDGLMLTRVELSARGLQDMLSGLQVVRPSWAFALELLVFLYLGVFVTFILPRVHLRVGSVVMALSLMPIWAVSIGLYFAAGYWVVAAFATVYLLSGFVIEAAREYVSFGMRGEILAENIESYKMLGLSLQGQGMLDMALEKFMRCPVGDTSVKDLLYNLALDFERKRMHQKARAVYEHILTAGPFKDSFDRIAALDMAAETVVKSPFKAASDGTVVAEGGGVLPTLGRYEISRELGRGAMGTVYLGRDPKINRDVAIKTLQFDEVPPAELDGLKQRFFKEAEAAGRLSHPNIVTIYDAGEEHDLAYLAMEVLKGEDLRAYCSGDSLLPAKEVLGMVADMADALAYAHENGVVHRDIKPANIMRVQGGTVKVTDFGIARVVESSKTHTGTILGTPSYMSPEQVEGKKLAGSSDIFSLGTMLYELLTGAKPFDGDSVATIMFNIAKCKYKSLNEAAPELPECCHKIVEKMLAKSIRSRYKNGSDAARDMRKCMERM